MSLFYDVLEFTNHSREPYAYHEGHFYCDIGNGTDPDKYDYCVIMQQSGKSVTLVMHSRSIIAFDTMSFINKDISYPLNYKRFDSTDEAYAKFMRWIGKMVKKDERGRYYNNKRYHEYDYSESDFDTNRLYELADEIGRKLKR
jgi:hypothetical protein